MNMWSNDTLFCKFFSLSTVIWISSYVKNTCSLFKNILIYIFTRQNNCVITLRIFWKSSNRKMLRWSVSITLESLLDPLSLLIKQNKKKNKKIEEKTKS